MSVRQRMLDRKVWLVLAGALLCGSMLAGCDDHVQITRDPDIRIPKHATWAWRPAAQARAARDSRPVVSRDVIGRGDTVVRDNDANNEMVRERVKTAIEQDLMQRGLKQVVDAEDADYLVDYHFAVERHNVTVQEVYPGAYPGIECGPFGCWQGWGWGPQVGYENIRFRAGTIAIVVVQRATNHLVYRAIGEKEVHRGTFTLTQDQISDVVQHMLGKLHSAG